MGQRPARAAGVGLAAFAFTIFLGAFLLFQVQPLIGKYILPWFGGTPATWTTCMLFFQLLLLGGYAYAHFSARAFSSRTQAVVHAVLLVVALLTLPITPEPSWKPGPGTDPTWHILLLLGACVGLPYLILSATGPLLQHWFSRVCPGVAPYRLFALSNLGSLLALVSYPFVFEPLLSRTEQAAAWSWSLGLFALACGWCAWRASRQEKPMAEVVAGVAEKGEKTGVWTVAFWVALPACASVLLLATTNKICQDVAVIPFLWVLPLSLYLLSFIICFDHARWYHRGWWGAMLWVAMGGAVYALFAGVDLELVWQVVIFCGALFVSCMVCHGELYRMRPPAGQLTAYYLSIAAGGALGGVLAAVVAPLAFDNYLELQVGLAACAFLFAAALWREFRWESSWQNRLGTRASTVGAVALALALVWQVREGMRDVVLATRNFYGVLRIFDYNREYPDDHVLMLLCGDITHGLQFVENEKSVEPVSYFHDQSGIGITWRELQARGPLRVGVVGLGIGTLAAYGRSGDMIRFYEINPEARRLAQTRFTYLADSAARLEFAMGDARLSLEREAPQNFDLLALDAFSGDAVPVHLLTREAVGTYLRHMKPNGVLAFQITNRHLDLLPVLKNVAREFKLSWAFISYEKEGEEWWKYSCDWVLLTRDPALLRRGPIAQASETTKESGASPGLWTDDRASLFKILK